jgi:FG-GAP-like repeat
MSFERSVLRCFILIFFFLLGTLSWQNQASAGQLQLAWTDNSNNEDGFKIERKTGTTGTYTQVATVGPNVTSYTDFTLADGATYCYRVAAFNSAGTSDYTVEVCATARATGQPISRIGVFRPSSGEWYFYDGSVVGCGVDACFVFGILGDVPVPRDYDGDGKADVAVYRDGIWYILRSSDGGVTAVSWGGMAQDIPVPRDYDGDGKADIAVYRDGIWYVLRSSDGGVTAVSWGGMAQDKPVPADYDGDGKTDIAVYREGEWYILRSSDGRMTTVGWGGMPQDIPVPADYDGDGKTDIAVYREGEWYILRSSDGRMTTVGWGGLPQDIPVPADYDGDGKADIAVYRVGTWYILRSSDGAQTVIGWGTAGDIPLN